MKSLTIRELDRDESGRRFGVRLFESENVLTEAQLRALRDAADAALESTGSDLLEAFVEAVISKHIWTAKVDESLVDFVTTRDLRNFSDEFRKDK